MTTDSRQLLPSVHRLLNRADVQVCAREYGNGLIHHELESILDAIRQEPDALSGATRDSVEDEIVRRLASALDVVRRSAPRRVINATGVLLHTSLGRAPLSQDARDAMVAAAGACQLEVEPVSGDRSYRGYQVAKLLHVLTGAAGSLIVNNNAGATLLTLQALCRGREVLISRGQLVEIGGSFRLPDIFAMAGVDLKEVGTTNRTRLDDYADAITDRTIAILRVHASNYRIVGFTSEPSTTELSTLARESHLLMFDDIGSGQFCPTASLRPFDEPDFQTSLAAGADLVLGSGDKLAGGPQAGLIVGRADLIEDLRNHPLARCLRIDKLNLAALHATLLAHARNPSSPDLPLHRMLTATVAELQDRAARICHAIRDLGALTVRVVDSFAEVGGGSCAGHVIPSVAINMHSAAISADDLARRLRLATPAVWSRIADDCVLLDLRSVGTDDDTELMQVLTTVV